MLLAVSGCLLGEEVRHNGGHTRDRFVTDELGKYAKYISFCPEHIAFGTPRDSIRLVRDGETLTVQNSKTQADVTQELQESSQEQLKMISSQPICGIILKAKSPSCGLGSIPAYRPNGYALKKEDGLFASLCKTHLPLMPIEEEARLLDPWLRENFIMQIFAYDDFEKFKATQPVMKDLVAFHQSYKFMLQSKNETLYRQMGQLVGNQDNLAFNELFEHYETLFKTAIQKKSSIGKTRNVLQHMAGFLKTSMHDVEKRTLHEQIEDYANKIVPLITPLSTLAMLAKEYDAAYLLGQKFLTPYPKELALRSDIRSGK